MCEKSIFFSSSFHSNIGKSTIQANSNRSLVDELQVLRRLCAREPGKLDEFVGIAGDEEGGVAGLQPELRADRLDALGADVVGERAAPAHARRLGVVLKRRLVLGAVEEQDVAEAGLALRPCAHEFMRSAKVRWPPPGAGIAHTSFFGCSSSRAKTLKPEPRKCSETSCITIGLRRSGLSVPYLRIDFGVGNARPGRRRHRLAAGKFLEHAANDRLHRREHVLLLDEAHFDVELVELAGQAVGARVLVAETRRDLEIAVEARHHQQLLVLLRRLRQRVEFARMNARRHQKVARAFRATRR